MQKVFVCFEKILRVYYPSIIMVFFLAVITYGMVVFNVVLAGDDWSGISMHFTSENSLQLGRWGQIVAWKLIGDNAFVPGFNFFCMLSLWLLSTLIILYQLNVLDNLMASIFMSTFIFFPFWCEMMLFQTNHLTSGFGLLLAILQGLSLKKALLDNPFQKTKFLWLGISSICLTLSLGMRQEYYVIGVMVFTLFILDRLLNSEQRQTLSPKKIIMDYIQVGVFAIIGIILYALITSLLQHLFHTPVLLNRGYSLTGGLVKSKAELVASIAGFLFQLKMFYFHTETFFPLFAKIIFLGFLIFLLHLLYSATKNNKILLLISVILVLLLLISPWSMGIIRVGNNVYRYNTLVSAALIYSGLIILCLKYSSNTVIKKWLIVLSLLIVLTFMFQQNLAMVTIKTLNFRDFQVGNRMLLTMEQLPEFENLIKKRQLRVVIVGNADQYQGRPFKPDSYTATNNPINICGVINCSIMQFHALLQLMAGYNVYFSTILFTQLPNQVQMDWAKQIKSMPSWPDKDSIKVLDDNVILKLSASK